MTMVLLTCSWGIFPMMEDTSKEGHFKKLIGVT